MTQNEPSGVVAQAAQMQQILVQALRQIEFAAGRVKARLPIGDVKEGGGGTELLPQLSGAPISMACFRRGQAFDQAQRGTQRTANSSSWRWRSGVSGKRASWSSPFWN